MNRITLAELSAASLTGCSGSLVGTANWRFCRRLVLQGGAHRLTL
jgi:hypothetical protein